MVSARVPKLLSALSREETLKSERPHIAVNFTDSCARQLGYLSISAGYLDWFALIDLQDGAAIGAVPAGSP